MLLLYFLSFILFSGILIYFLNKKIYKKYNIEIYINNEIVGNSYTAKIHEVICPVFYLKYDNKKTDITEDIILISRDPIIANILKNGHCIKIGTIADDCDIFIKYKKIRFRKNKIKIYVLPGEPYSIEIIQH